MGYVYVCISITFFSLYEEVKDKYVMMRNFTNACVIGGGEVVLKFTLGNTMTLKNVHHVPNIRKNFVSGSLLNKEGFKWCLNQTKLSFQKIIYILAKNMCMMVFLNLTCWSVLLQSLTIIFFMCIIESFDIWHERLGHVNSRTIERMMNLCLVPKYDVVSFRCE